MSFSGQYRIAAAVPKLNLADPAANAKEILALYKKASQQGAAIVCFPELALTGASCGDLFLQIALQQATMERLLWLREKTKGNSTILIVGLPLSSKGHLFNCAAVLQNGEICGFVGKEPLSVQERRCFTSIWDYPQEEEEIPIHASSMLFQAQGVNFGIVFGDDAMQPDSPASILAAQGADLIFTLSAEMETLGRQEERKLRFQEESARLHTMSVFLPASGRESVADGLYGGAPLMALDGRVIAEGKRFSREKQLLVGDFVPYWLHKQRENWPLCSPKAMVELSEIRAVENDIPALKLPKHPFVPESGDFSEEILSIQANALANRVEHIHAKRLVLGLSGGLDSTLALLACIRCCDLLNKKHDFVLAVTMPGMGTTGRTKGNAIGLAKGLGAELREIDIRPSVRQHFKDIGHDEDNHNVVYENSQARERTQILMDLANAEGGLHVGTGDLSEIALGWCTYNGDHISMYSVNGSIPKTLIRAVIEQIAAKSSRKTAAILRDINATPVSPELLPGEQKTESIIGNYDLHDFFLYYFMKYHEAPRTILALAESVFQKDYPKELIKGCLLTFVKRFFSQQFKRNAMPDGPKVTDIDLSARTDWQMPSDASPNAWLDF